MKLPVALPFTARPRFQKASVGVGLAKIIAVVCTPGHSYIRKNNSSCGYDEV